MKAARDSPRASSPVCAFVVAYGKHMSNYKILISKTSGSILRSSLTDGSVAFASKSDETGDIQKPTICANFTLGQNRFCVNTISWPEGYWRRMSSPCMRLVIWCNAYHDGDTYVTGSASYIYRLVQNLGPPRDNLPGLQGESALEDVVLNIPCDCGGSGVPAEFATGDGQSDAQCLPDGDQWFDWLEDSNYFSTELGSPLPAFKRHMIWAVISPMKAFAAKIGRPDPGFEREIIPLGLAHMVCHSAGVIMHSCECGDFNCNG